MWAYVGKNRHPLDRSGRSARVLARGPLPGGSPERATVELDDPPAAGVLSREIADPALAR